MPNHTDEFDRMLKQREALWHQTLRSLSNSIIVRGSMGPGPEPEASQTALDMGSILARAENMHVALKEQQSLRQMRSYDDLVGSARFYGIPSPERIPADELEEMVAARREGFLAGDRSETYDNEMNRVLRQGPNLMMLIGSTGQQTLRILGNLAERIPFMRDPISRSEKMREADRWFGQMLEGFTADLPEDQRAPVRSVNGALGMFPAAYASWQVLGALGAAPGAATVGARISPLGRSAIRGMLSEVVIQDPTAPLSEQAVNAAFGAAFGGAEAIGGIVGQTLMGAGLGAIGGSLADDGDPRSMLMGAALGAAGFGLGGALIRKLNRSYRVRGIEAEFLDVDDGSWVEGQWSEEMFLPGTRGLLPPAGGTGQLPPTGGGLPPMLQPGRQAGVTPLGGGTSGEVIPMAPQRPIALTAGPQDVPDLSATAALPGETEAARIARLEENARRWADEQLAALDAEETAIAAAQLSKQATIAESPILADIAAVPKFDDADAAWAVVESFPGQVGIVQNVGDVAETVRRIVQEQMPAGIGPTDFRVVRRRLGVGSAAVRAEGRIFTGAFHGEAIEAAERAGLTPEELDEFGDVGGFLSTTGRLLTRSEASEIALRNRQWNIERQLTDPFLSSGIEEVAAGTVPPGGMDAQYVLPPPEQTDILVSTGRPITDQMVQEYETYGMFSGQRAKLATGQEVVISMMNPSEKTWLQPFGGENAPVGFVHAKGDLVRAWRDPQGVVHTDINEPAYNHLVMLERYGVTPSEKLVGWEAGHFGPEGFVGPTEGMPSSYWPKLLKSGMARVKPVNGGPEMDVSVSDLLPLKASGVVDDFPGLYEGFRSFADGKLVGELRASGIEPAPLLNLHFDWKMQQAGHYVNEELGWTIQKNNALKGDKWVFSSSKTGQDVFPTLKAAKEAAAEFYDSQRRASGAAPVESPLFDADLASQVPLLMDEFISMQGIDPKSPNGAVLRMAMEQKHIEALRQQAPAAEQAMLRVVQAELQKLSSEKGPITASLNELAATRGFTVEPHPTQGLVLVDDLTKGATRIPVGNEAGAREFLQGFHREAIDDSPVTPFPLEMVETPPGYSETTGKLPGDYSTAEQMGDAMETSIALWFSQGGEETLQAMLQGGALGDFGGGGFRPPPPPPPLASGIPPERPQLPSGESVYEQHAAQWRRARRDDPRRLRELTGQMNDFVDRTFVPMRNAIERMQQHSRSLGVSTADYFGSMRELHAGHNKMVTDAHPWEERAYEILNPVRNRFWRDGTFWEILNAAPDQQWHLMRNAGFTSAERQAAAQFKVLMDDWIENVARPVYPNMGYRENYVTWFRQFEDALPGDPYRKPHEAQWGPENPRGENLDEIEKNMGAIIPRYFRAFYKVQYMQPQYEHMKRMMASEEVPEVIREAVRGYAEAKMWGLDPSKDLMVSGTTWMLNSVGKAFGQTFTTQDSMKLWLTQFNLAYQSGLGGRIDPLVRDLPQGLIGVAQVGLDKGIPALRRMLRDEAYGARARELARRHGWIQTGGGASIDPDVFGASRPGPGSTTGRESLARVMDVVQDRVLAPISMRHGIHGTVLDWLAPYGRLGDFARTWNGVVGYDSAMDAIQRYVAAVNEQGPLTVPREDLQRQLLKDSRVSRYQGSIQQTFLDLVNAGDYDKAAGFFGGEVAASQNLYGMAEQPRTWQAAGPITGKKAMQWMTFNSQTLANLTHIMRDKHIDLPDKAAYAAQVGTLQAMFAGAQLVTGWNFMRMSLIGIGFGFAGQGIFDFINKVQKIDAWWKQHDPTGRALNPDQRALLGSPWDIGGGLANSALNPWAGGMRSVQGLTESHLWGPEATARFLVTGERGDPWIDRMSQGRIEWDTRPRSETTIPPSLENPANALFLQGPTPAPAPPVTQFGVHEPERVYAHPRSGAPVVDTSRRTLDGRVPTHRVDVPSGRLPNETWEDYENRVLSMPEESFPPEVRQSTNDLELLEPETRAKLQAMLMTAQMEGVPIGVGETLRTQKRQEWLFRQGRATPGAPVTWTLTTNHADGRAADLRSTSEQGYRWIQENAQRFGLQVLGDFDAGHVFNAAPSQQQAAMQTATAGLGAM